MPLRLKACPPEELFCTTFNSSRHRGCGDTCRQGGGGEEAGERAVQGGEAGRHTSMRSQRFALDGGRCSQPFAVPIEGRPAGAAHCERQS